MHQRAERVSVGVGAGLAARVAGLVMAVCACLMLASADRADALIGESTVLPDGTVRTDYLIGPITVTSGQNRIDYETIVGSERPNVDGWITRIEPNLVYTDGTIPKSSKIMFHHGVWLNMSRIDATSGGSERFYATGEEKTIMELPAGYGYRYQKSDNWILNHMIHNLVPQTAEVYITYKIDFVPDSLPAAASIKPVRPIWMDIDNGSVYPVFDVHRGEGGADGEFTYPQDADPSPYRGTWKKNEWRVDRDGVLLHTTGHVHTGGLSTNLFLRRDGAKYGGKVCEQPPSFAGQLGAFAASLKRINTRIRKAKRAVAPRKLKRLRKAGKVKRIKRLTRVTRAKVKRLNRQKASKVKGRAAVRKRETDANAAYRACTDSQPSVEGNRVHLFDSKAHYFDPAGPISWDMAMYTTKEDWRVAVKAGDMLELQTTYETEMASWYESMGINVVYMADDTDGDDPYVTKVDGEGKLNHGHYEENDDHGGGLPLVGPDPATLADGPAPTGTFTIGGYNFGGGDFRLPGAAGRPPTVERGQTFTFRMSAGDQANEIWHSLTSCKAPCNRSTGISYPIADGEFQFDSGQLGKGGPPTVNRDVWTTPSNLPVGTHTFFCRIHPLMRGAVRVVPPK